MQGRKPVLSMVRKDPRERSIAAGSIASQVDYIETLPDWPDHLDDVAKAKWIDVCEELIKLKSLREC